MSALALAMAAFSSCGEKNKPIDFEKITEDGFYVAGEATGFDKLSPKTMMAAGVNEAAEQTKRDGMYEKYLVLDANKEFYLVLNEAGKQTRYSTTLIEFTPDLTQEIYGDNPKGSTLKGVLSTGSSAPAMKVSKKALYHVVLDLNKANDLKSAQIILSPVTWGVRGAMNGWGFTEMTSKEEEGVITLTIKDADMPANGEFKFAYNSAWKITLDDEGKVKANTNLGLKDGKLTPGGDNIKVEKAGLYDITLSFSLEAGEISKSYTHTVTLTQESTLPTACYMIGEAFGNWKWASEGIVEFLPAHSEPGVFWAVRYLEKGKGFKFSTINVKDDWSKAFGKLTTNNGFTNDGEGNAVVAENGLYMIEIDFKNNVVEISPAKILGLGDAFGNNSWADLEKSYYKIDGKLAKTTTVAAGALRTAAVSKLHPGDFWHREFIIKDGKIVYRGAGGDPENIPLTAGQEVSFDFNAGTGSIK